MIGPFDVQVILASKQSPSNVGGLAAYQRHLASLLGESGVTVTFLSEARKDETGQDALADAHVRYQTQAPYRRLLSALCSRRRLHWALECFVTVLYFRWISKKTKNLRAIHFTGTGWDSIGFAFANFARMKGVRFSVWPAVHPGDWGDDKIDIRLYKKADVVFCQSDSEVRHLANLGVPSEKLIRSGLPPMCEKTGDGDRLRRNVGIESRPCVLFLGRRDSGKGYEALLDVWAAVLSYVPDAVLLLAGKGGEEYSTKRNLLPNDSVRDFGVPDENEKADLLAACDVFCLPSRNESFGIAYVEAMFYGKPVICGTAPASRELIAQGVTGLWASQKNEELSSALIQLLNDPAERIKMGRMAEAVVREKYSDINLLNSHLKAFNIPDQIHR